MRRNYFGDAAFFQTLFRIALPIAIQQLFMNLLNAVDVLMIGQLGDTAVAAVGLANQVYFLLSLFLFGVGSGSSIFSAQFWGKRDLTNLRHVLGLALAIGVSGSILFTLAGLLIPSTVLGLYSQDPAVIEVGSRYLRIVALSYIPTAITVMYGMVLRSTREVKVPMMVSVGALTCKTLLAYLLIFGRLGFPTLGVVGGAVATCCARALECAALLAIIYVRQLPAAARARELFSIDRALVRRVAVTSLPVVLGEVLWSLGITVYSGVYAHIGTQSIAAVNIAASIESIALVPFMGLGFGCAIILGNAIGAGESETAERYARQFLRLAIAGALLVGVCIFLISGLLLNLYRISPDAEADARGVLLVIAAALWLKSANMIIIVGILRSGGDTRFGLFVDVTPLWLIGVPLALVGGFVLHLPVYYVALLVMADEATKFVIGLWRVWSGLWIHNVVHAL